MKNGLFAIWCCIALIGAESTSFIEVSLPVTSLAPILSQQCAEIGGSQSSCHKLCLLDDECHGYVTSRIARDPCTCRYLTVPLCTLQEPVKSHSERKNGDKPTSHKSWRAAVKSSRYLSESQVSFAYPGYSPVFEMDFKVEFLERQITWKNGESFVKSSMIKSIITGDSYDLSPINNEIGGFEASRNSEIACTDLCKNSQEQFGKSCAMAFESTIKFNNIRTDICRIFDFKAFAGLKTLQFTKSNTSSKGFQVSGALTVFPSNKIRNDLCLSPVRWNYHRVIVEKSSTSDGKLSLSPNFAGSSYAGKPEGARSSNPTDHSNSNNVTNGRENAFAQAVFDRRNFWSRFAFCAIIPLSLVAIAVLSSVLACIYSKTQINGQLAQFWRWERAGIPSNDFRPADDDDARSLIF